MVQWTCATTVGNCCLCVVRTLAAHVISELCSSATSTGFQYDSEAGAVSTNIEYFLPATPPPLPDAASSYRDLAQSQSPRVQYSSASNDEAHQLKRLEPSWGSCADYLNGGPAFVGCGSDGGSGHGFLVTARYKDFANSPAAVR